MRWSFSLKGLGSKWRYKRLLNISLAIALMTFGLLFWHLGSWTSGLGPDEVATRSASSSIHYIANHPVNGPYNILVHFAQKLSAGNLLWLRSASAIFTGLCICLFYIFTRPLFGKVMAASGSLLLATMPIVLISGRVADPAATYLLVIPLVAAYFWVVRTKTHKRQAFFCLAALAALSLYTPGLIWFIALGLWLTRKQLYQELKLVKKRLFMTAVSLVCLVILAPLVWAIYNQPSVVRSVLAIPAHWDNALNVAKSIVWMGLSLVWRAPQHRSQIIGRLPLLNIVQVVLAIIGSYALWQKLRRPLYGLLSMIGMAVVLAAINSNYLLLMLALLPIALLETVGLRYLYVQWRSVFPSNPIPKAVSLFMILAVVGINMLFGIRYGLIAWPHTVDTRNLYVLK